MTSTAWHSNTCIKVTGHHVYYLSYTWKLTASKTISSYRHLRGMIIGICPPSQDSFEWVHCCHTAPRPSRLCSLRHFWHGEGLFIQSGNKLSTGRHHYKPQRPTSLPDWKIALQIRPFPKPCCHSNSLLSHFKSADLQWMILMGHFTLGECTCFYLCIL